MEVYRGPGRRGIRHVTLRQEQGRLQRPALNAGQAPELIARAFALFASARPRPVPIEVPVDVLAGPNRSYPGIGVAPRNPGFVAPAQSFGCAVRPRRLS